VKTPSSWACSTRPATSSCWPRTRCCPRPTRPLPLAGGSVRHGEPQEDGTGELRARTATNPSRLVYLEARRDRRRETAIYGEATYDLGLGWTASLGGRAFTTTVHTTSNGRPIHPVTRVRSEADLQWRLAEVHPAASWGDGGMLYLLTSEGFRSGGFNTGGTSALSALRSSFKPDHLRNYEIGGSAEPFKGRMTCARRCSTTSGPTSRPTNI
jgi:iron complex outermembrane receptor protein